MAYATSQDLVDRFGETEIARLSSTDGATTVAVDVARCNIALESATALAETYLRAQVAVPVVNPQLAIVDAVCDLARYNLAHGGGREPTEQIRKRRDEAMSWLRSVARGEAQLAEMAPRPATGGRYSDRERVVSHKNLKGFV